MTSMLNSTAAAFDAQANPDALANSEGNIIAIPEEDFTDGCKSASRCWGGKARVGERHAGNLLPNANYNDEPDPAVKATVEKLVDTDRIIILERINPGALPRKYAYHFAKRLFDIVSCLIALVICAIPMAVIAIMVKRDSPGPVFYIQERLGWSIIGQKSGVVHGMTSRPAFSALNAHVQSHPRVGLGVAS